MCKTSITNPLYLAALNPVVLCHCSVSHKIRQHKLASLIAGKICFNRYGISALCLYCSHCLELHLMHCKWQPVVFTVSYTNIINEFMIYHAGLFSWSTVLTRAIGHKPKPALLHLITELWAKFTCNSSFELVCLFRGSKLHSEPSLDRW